VRTLVPAPMKVSEDNSSQIPQRASTRGLSLSFCLRPLAQMATSRPPGFNIFKACTMCLISSPFANVGFITMRSNVPRSPLHSKKSACRVSSTPSTVRIGFARSGRMRRLVCQYRLKFCIIPVENPATFVRSRFTVAAGRSEDGTGS
jgi:hypothetical protein